MEKGASFLFSGITFDKKRFARDFSRFKEKKDDDDMSNNKLSLADSESFKIEEKPMPTKKRKRKGVALEPVEGFNVFFKSSNVVAKDEQTNLKKKKDDEQTEDEVSQRKKELDRQKENDALFRKKHSIHVLGANVPSPLHNFAELKERYGCKKYLLQNFAELGFKEPTPIQRQAIPVLLSGRECFACAPTGSGKTMAFVCPMLTKLQRASKDGVRAVIICPVRELAAQTMRECKKMAKGKKFYIKLLTSQLLKGTDFSKFHCDVLISTPKRLQYATRKRKLDLSRVEYLVLDEADKLFELGFVKQIDSVVKACTNPSKICSLFSATLPDTVEELARTIMHDAVRIIIGRKNSASESIKQRLVFAGNEGGKLMALRQSFGESLNPPVLLFVSNITRAKQLYKALEFTDIRVDVIHADLSQEQRDNAVDNFRAGKTWVLIATDVVARGMDFKGVNCVINYDFPDCASTYIHRIGRCGRAGRSGEAITFYTEEDFKYMKNIGSVMANSGSDVPAWIMALPKGKWKDHRPSRQTIF